MDLHEVYHIDIEQPGLLDERTFRWLRQRIAGLLSPHVSSRLKTALGL